MGAGVYWVREANTEPSSSTEFVGNWEGFDFLVGFHLAESGRVRPFMEVELRQPFDRGNSDEGTWRAGLQLAIRP